jgi:predicted alpha/beta-fold hydrolase
MRQSNVHEIFQGYPGLDISAVKTVATIREFDHFVTRVVFKYPTVDHYYSDASSIKKLQHVTVPLLCVSARDDPISLVVPEPDHVHSNPNVILCVTNSGGHLGFFESDFDPNADKTKERNVSSQRKESKSGLKMWSARVVAEFAESILAHELERKQKQ